MHFVPGVHCTGKKNRLPMCSMHVCYPGEIDHIYLRNESIYHAIQRATDCGNRLREIVSNTTDLRR